MPETHMLKPYVQRVTATQDLMKSFIGFVSDHADEIIKLRKETIDENLTRNSFPIAWKWDKTKYTEISFKGYEAGTKTSLISGQPRLFYDRNKPYEKMIPFYNQYIDTLSVARPIAYVIPQGWWKVIERLEANNVKMQRFKRDTFIEVESYRIENYQSAQRPFEGHHLNSAVQLSKRKTMMRFRAGDVLIPMNQVANRFLIQVLEPHAEDSYFAWNFFDPILGQKEGFSDYVFEETALNYLNKNPRIRLELEAKKSKDSVFANNGRAQLNFVFQNSPFYEPAHLQYPVYRVMK
jgi:hypothetical protein